MNDVEPCPYCSHEDASRVTFTPWGGVVGPWVLSLVRCTGCTRQYNGRTGKKVERAIRVYTWTAMLVLAVVMALAIYSTSMVKRTDPRAADAATKTATRLA